MVPQEFCGVWKVTAATSDGINQPLAEDPDGSLSAGECGTLEIIIYENRAIIVETSGQAMVCRARVLTVQPELKIEFTGYGFHGKRDGPSYAILKRIDERTIQMAWCEADAQRVNATKGGRQFVYTATR
jgi:hypothetical protein